ncbi:MAG TPA: TlpA disulfide reductase family protein [Thermoanaerobaculia bacterium]|nr:TlpA disulfide reductase family protein [Thermoanaerobaculia bacterium]
MRGRWIAALAGLLLLLGAGAGGAQNGWRLSGLDGGELREADLARGTAVVVIWAGWSPRCRGIVDQVNALAAEWGGRARVVTVNFQESPDEARGFLRGKSLRVPVFLDTDGAFSKRHHVSTLPGLLVYKDGRVAYQGKLPDDPSEVVGRALQ